MTDVEHKPPKLDHSTMIRMDLETWRLLRELARLRAERLGGRPSQSAVLRELIREAGAGEDLGTNGGSA